MTQPKFKFVEADFQLTTAQQFEKAKILAEWDKLTKDAQREILSEALTQLQKKDNLLKRLMRYAMLGF